MNRDAPKVGELTPAQHTEYERVVDTIYGLGMDGAWRWSGPSSLTAVARKYRTSVRVVLKLMGHAFRRRGRRWELRGPEQWPRGADIISRQGFVQTMVRSPKTAERIAMHYDAIRLVLSSRDLSALREFEGKFIVDGYGIRRYFCMDPVVIRRAIRLHRIEIKSMNGHWCFTRYKP